MFYVEFCKKICTHFPQMASVCRVWHDIPAPIGQNWRERDRDEMSLVRRTVYRERGVRLEPDGSNGLLFQKRARNL